MCLTYFFVLLIGLEKYGVGNWKAIADFLGSNKTAKQIEEHYWQLYMGIQGYCLPQECLIDNEVTQLSQLYLNEPTIDAEGNEVVPADDLFRIPVKAGNVRGERVLRDVGKDTTTVKSKDKSAASQLPTSDLPGYMPLREDFEVEYENDAEQWLAEMEFNPDDHPSEVELKLQVIQIYNHKILEREKRRKFVIERGIIDVKKQQAFEKKLTKAERDLVGKLRPFARFQTAEQHETLVDGVLKAHRLRQQIELYKIYRQMGFTDLDEVRKFEMDKKNRDLELKAQKQREAASYLYETPGNKSSNDTASGVSSRRGTISAYQSSQSLAAVNTSEVNEKPRKRGRPHLNHNQPAPVPEPIPIESAESVSVSLSNTGIFRIYRIIDRSRSYRYYDAPCIHSRSSSR